MKPFFNLILIWILASPFLFASENPLVVETKTIDKSFTVNSNAELRINNKYGNLNLTTWDKNQIGFHIEIKVDGKNAEKVKERINGITVEFNANSGLVSAETIIKTIRNANNINITINYFVKLPKTNSISLTNKYGNISLDALKGSSAINLSYGNLNFGKLENALNTFDLDYVTSAQVDYLKSANIMMDYSQINIGQSEIINLNADYSDANFGKIEDLVNDMDYGNLYVESAETISSVADYSNIKVGNIQKSFVASGSYGSIAISNVKKGFNKISIGADYSDVSIGIDSGADYTFTGNFKYGGLQFPSHLKMTKQIEKSTSKSYEGVAGKGSAEVLINMNYGGAKIK